MNEEEIEKRIEVCKNRLNGYREVGNSNRISAYEREIDKWEELLSQLNPKRDEELKEYKRGYQRLQDTIDKAIEKIDIYIKELNEQIEATEKVDRVRALGIIGIRNCFGVVKKILRGKYE